MLYRKNLVNRSKDQYNRLISHYNHLKPRLEENKKAKLSDLVKDLKKDIDFKLETKKSILNSIMDKSKILEELKKKKK